MNILTGYEKIKSDKTGVVRNFLKLHLINDDFLDDGKRIGYFASEVFMSGTIENGKVVADSSVRVEGEFAIGSYCRVLKEAVNGRDEVAFISFNAKKGK